MKKLKFGAAVAAFSLVAGFAFAETEVSVSNKVESDLVNIEKVGDESNNDFAGIKNKTSFEYTSEKVDALLELEFWSTKKTTAADKDYFAVGHTEDDAAGYDFGDSYIEVRPFEQLGFEFHEKVWTAGSYFPIWDDNASSGNIGSDFGVLVRPAEGLVIGAGLDFVSAFGNDDEKPVANFGAEYTTEQFAVGAAVRNVAGGDDELSFGIFGSLLSVENLNLNAGFAYNDSVEPDVGAVNGDLLTLGATWEKDALHAALDLATNFGSSEDQEYDLYAAVSVGYNITEDLSADCAVAAVLDFESDDLKKADERFHINPSVTYTTGNHEFSAGVNIFIGEDYSCVNFPVSWTYNF